MALAAADNQALACLGAQQGMLDFSLKCGRIDQESRHHVVLKGGVLDAELGGLRDRRDRHDQKRQPSGLNDRLNSALGGEEGVAGLDRGSRQIGGGTA